MLQKKDKPKDNALRHLKSELEKGRLSGEYEGWLSDIDVQTYFKNKHKEKAYG